MRRSDTLRRLLASIIGLSGFLGLWYGVSYLGMSEARRSVALPPPHRVVADGFLTWGDHRGLKPILQAMMVTGRIALFGLAISAAIGITLAILMNRSKMVEWVLFPYAVIVQTLPVLALVPIIKVWFDTGMTGRVIACVLVAVFPIITNTLLGLKSTSRQLHDVFTLAHASRWQRLWHLEMPAARPAMFTGLRIAAGGCVIGAIVGDFFFRQGDVGIGRLIDNYQKDARTTELFAAAAVSSLFGVVIFVIFGFVSHRLLRRWHESAQD